MLRQFSIKAAVYSVVILAAATLSDARPLHGGAASGGASNELSPLTVIEPTGVDQADMVFTMGIPFAPGVMDGTKHVAVRDGATTYDCDTNNLASDLQGDGRTGSISCHIPGTTTGSQVLQPVAYVESGAPASGTDITAAEIASYYSGLGDTAPVALTNINGVSGTWSASLASVLASGNSIWVDKDTESTIGKYRSGGGIVTEWLFYSPVFKAGVPHAQVYVIFDVKCYKASRAAVSGGNPILGCVTDFVFGNDNIDASAPIDNYYGLSVGTAGAVANYPNANPTQTLTGIAPTATLTIASPGYLTVTSTAGLDNDLPLKFQTTGALPTGLTAGTTYYTRSVNGHGANTFEVAATRGGASVNFTGSQSGTQTVSYMLAIAPITASTALFDINYKGKVIADGTGVATINWYTDSTNVKANIYKPFNTASLTSGNYTLYGINHPYGARFKVRGMYGFAHNPPTVEDGKAYVGAAWNGGTLTGGPGAYFIASKVVQNYVYPVSGYTNVLTQVDSMGTNPMAYTQGGYGNLGGFVGDLQAYLQTSGQNDAIGVYPDWDPQALRRWDANAPIKVFKNAGYWATFPTPYRDLDTGKTVNICNAGTLPACSGSTNYIVDCRQTGSCINFPNVYDGRMTPWSSDGFQHDPGDFYVAALLTGDWFWIDNQQREAVTAWVTSEQYGSGLTGVKKPVYYNASSNERAVTWMARSIIHAVFLTPDSSTVLGNSKAVVEQYLDNIFNAPTWGVKAQYLDQTGPGLLFASNGPHYTGPNENQFHPFQVGYSMSTYAHANELGMLDTNGFDFYKWQLENYAKGLTDPNVQPGYIARWYFAFLYNTSAACLGTQAYNWEDIYIAQTKNFTQIPNWRNPAATMTLSGTSGSVTATLSAGNYMGAGSYYVGSWVRTFEGGLGRITSVIDANHFVMDTTASQAFAFGGGCPTGNGNTFGFTSYANTEINLPPPAPSDPVGTDLAAYIASPDTDFFVLWQLGAMYADEIGIPNGAAAKSYIYGLTGGTMQNVLPYKWGIGPR